MIKKTFFLIGFLFIVIFSKAQVSKDAFYDSYNVLMLSLGDENWVQADSIAFRLADESAQVDSLAYAHKVLNYICIYTTAALMNNDSLSQEEALVKVKKFIGADIVMPAHPAIKNCFTNCTHFCEDRSNTLFSCVNNSDGTQIFSFEYVKMKKKINDKQFDEKLAGKMVILSGKLIDIQTGGLTFPHFVLEIVDGEYEIMQ